MDLIIHDFLDSLSVKSRQPQDERILEQVFSTYWSQFEENFKNALKTNPLPDKVEPRSKENILAEILESTRSFQQRLRRLEERSKSEPEEAPIRKQSSMALASAEKLVEDLWDSGMPPDAIINYLSESGFRDYWVSAQLARLNATKPRGNPDGSKT